MFLPLNTAISNKYKESEKIFGGNFPVGEPIQNSEPERKTPRSYQPTTGQNIILSPRSEFPQLIPFSVLDYVARNTDLIQIAENLVLNQISGRKWDIVVEDPEDKKDYTENIKKIKEFFKHPDKERTYSRWIRKALKNIIRYDAFTLYKRKDNSGRLYGLNIIDGSTIKVITDSNGNKPLPPYPSYQQIIYGTSRGQWNKDELIYAPLSEELKGNYGISAVERIVVATLKYLRKQQFDYSFYKDGAYPEGDLYSLKPNDQSPWNAEQILEFQEAWNDEMATDKNRQSLKFVPDGTLQKTKEHSWDTVQEEWFGCLVATSIGTNPKIFSKQVNRATADSDDRQQTELGLKPYIKHIEDILTDVIQNDLGEDALAFKIIDEKLEDQAAKVEKNIKYVMSGIYNRNEIRKEEGKNPVAGGDSYTVQVGNALIPVDKVEKMVTVAPDSDNSEVTSKETVLDDKFHAVTTDKIDKKAENPKNVTKIATKNIDNPKEVKKAESQYKNFLIKRFKENRPLKGYENNLLAPEFIKTIENQLDDIKNLGDIIEIFKADSEKGNNLNNLKNYILKNLKKAQEKFIAYYEKYFKNEDINAINAFNFTEDLDLTPYILEFRKTGFNNGKDKLNLTQQKQLSINVEFGELEASKKALEYNDKLVTGVNQATINFIQRTISDAILNGKSWEWIKEQLLDNNYYAFSEKRAECIAKTEEARALNDGTLQMWSESGIVKYVNVVDGDGCAICEEINGTTQTLEWAIENSLQHPNCLRDFYCIVEDIKEQ